MLRKEGHHPLRSPSSRRRWASLVNNGRKEGGRKEGGPPPGRGLLPCSHTHRVGRLHHVLDGAAHAGQALPHGEPDRPHAPRRKRRQSPPRPGAVGGGRGRGGGWNGVTAVPPVVNGMEWKAFCDGEGRSAGLVSRPVPGSGPAGGVLCPQPAFPIPCPARRCLPSALPRRW